MTTREQIWWDRVRARDPGAAGLFVYAVTTTGVYCEPGCASRRPRAENVRFFAGAADAEAAGFRPCKRCRPRRDDELRPEVAAAVSACRRLEEGAASVAEIAAASPWSERHLRRLFRHHTGVTMSAFARACRAEAVRAGLAGAESVTDAAHAAGTPPGRALYEDVAERLGMTPGRYQSGGDGEHIVWGLGATVLGEVLIAATARGLCAVRLGAGEELARELAAEFPRAELIRDDDALARAFAVVADLAHGRAARKALPLDLRGTTFQMEVWETLARVPAGETWTYARLAAELGRPRAPRAAASACGANPAALIVPCHRIVRADGGLGGYRWGVDAKRRLLEFEAGGGG